LHLGDFTEKSVTIRGEIVTGREVFYLQDPSCKVGPKTGEYVWPPNLWLTPPNARASLSENRKYDRASFDHFWAEFDIAKAKSRSIQVVATVTGTIRTRKDLGAVRAGDGQWLTNGFGHQNMFPAEMVLESISNWIIRPTKPSAIGQSSGE